MPLDPAGRPRLPYRTLATSLLALALLALPAVQAAPAAERLAELPIEELLALEVFSASRFLQKRSEAPAAVTVITAADIEAHGWRTLAEILASMPGLYLGYDRNYSYLGARGFLRPGDYNTRFLLLVDGSRTNDAVYDQASIGSEFILDVDLIERVEFVHGPGSSLYGANALFGVVNVITKDALAMRGPQAALEVGSAGARKLRASYGIHSEGGTQWLISASSWRRDGDDLYFPEFDTASTNNGVAVGLDHDRADSVFVKGKAGGIVASLAHARRTKGIPTASYSQLFNDPGARTIDTQTLLDLRYRRALSARAELYSRVYWGAFDYDGDYVYGPAPVTINRDVTHARWWGGELRLTASAGRRHKLVAGIEYQRDYRRDQANFDVAPYLSYLDSSRDGWRWGVYLQDEWRLHDDLVLNAGLRHDQHDSSGGTWNPRLGVVYSLSPVTSLRAAFATAYRAPNAYELYYDTRTAGGQKANPELGTERVRAAEVGLERRLGANARLAVSLFRNSVSDLITHVLDANDALLVFENLERVHAHGASVELEQAWDSGARVRGSLSLQRAHDAASGAELVNSPNLLAKFNASFPLRDGRWRSGIEARYVGARRTLAGGETGGYWLANLTLSSIRLAPGLSVGLSVYNLFDRQYAHPGAAEHVQDALAQDGRTLRLRLDHAF